MSILIKDVKVLWGRSNDTCTFPDCWTQLTFGNGSGLIGEMAHIVAESADGPRGISPLNKRQRNSYENLILLCPTHHTMVDKDPATWTVEKLQEMKRQHEETMRSRKSKGSVMRPNLSTIHYLNVPRILFDLAAQGIYLHSSDIDLDRPQGLRALDFGTSLRVLTQLERWVQQWPTKASDLKAPEIVTSENVGSRVWFDTTFRTKNVPAPDEVESGVAQHTGDIDKDPHLYTKVNARKVYLTIDPRWITTMTGFVYFKSGIAKFAGLGFLGHVGQETAIITPLVVGFPNHNHFLELEW